jgi:hypothetical protein
MQSSNLDAKSHYAVGTLCIALIESTGSVI